MSEIGLQDAKRLLAILHKRRVLLVTSALAGIAVALLFNYTTRPVYQARALILIDRGTPDVLPGKGVTDTSTEDNNYYLTQYQLLAGRNLAEAVVRRLSLNRNPDLLAGPVVSPWERVERRLSGRPPAAPIDDEGIPISPAAAAFRSRLTVDPRPGGRLVDLIFIAYDAKLAADSVNTLAQLYVEQSLEFRFHASSEATDWLSARVREQQDRLKAAERALQVYREQEGLVNFEERLTLADQKLGALSTAFLNARTQRIAKESLYQQLRSVPATNRDSVLLPETQTRVDLRARLADLQQERARSGDTLGERHPEIHRLDREIAAASERLAREDERGLASVEAAWRAALREEESLQKNLDLARQESLEVNRKAVELSSLKREVESSQQTLSTLLNRSQQTGLESELKATNVRVVEPAEVPGAPIAPQHRRNYQLGLAVGLLLGLALTGFFEYFDTSFRTPEDVRDVLDLPFLGIVPAVTGTSRAGGSAVVRNPASPIAESYRLLRTNLIFTAVDPARRVLLVSSASPGEGKSTTVANLAWSLAQNGARVLAIDADLRRPTLHQHFGVPRTPGLSDLVVGKVTPADAVRSTDVPGLHLLPCGYIAPNPAELLGSPAFRDIIGALRTHYDWVIFDTPPILGIADTAVLSPAADGLVLVVGAETGTRSGVSRAVAQVRTVGGKILGVILNRVDLQRNSYYYSQYYGEYYRSYYASPGPAAEDRPERVS